MLQPVLKDVVEVLPGEVDLESRVGAGGWKIFISRVNMEHLALPTMHATRREGGTGLWELDNFILDSTSYILFGSLFLIYAAL